MFCVVVSTPFDVVKTFTTLDISTRMQACWWTCEQIDKPVCIDSFDQVGLFGTKTIFSLDTLGHDASPYEVWLPKVQEFKH